MKMAEHWYAIRTTPSAQRMARVIPDLAEDKQHRRGETIVERNLRNEGFDVFMPAFRKETRRHRSKKVVEMRYPLLVGYCFVLHDAAKGFDSIREIDGVSGVLCMNPRLGPQPFSEEDISVLVFAQHEREQQFKHWKMASVENARHNRRMDLTTELGRLLPKGRSRTVSLRYHAEKCISSLNTPVKAKVLGIIAALDNLEDDHSLDEHRQLVYG